MKLQKRRIKHHRKLKGQITVFLSLLLTILLLFSLTCTEGVRIYLGKGRAVRSMVSAQESVMADYNTFLWENYHFFAVDETYLTGNPIAMQLKMEQYMRSMLDAKSTKGMSHFYTFTIQNLNISEPVYLTDEEGEIIKNQIREYMKYKVGEEVVSEFLKNVSFDGQKKSVEDARSEFSSSNEQAKEAKKQEEQQKTEKDTKQNTEEISRKNSEKVSGDTEAEENKKEKVEDPRDSLKSILKTGIVEITTGKSDISKDVYDSMEFSNGFSEEEEKELSFEDAEQVLPNVTLEDAKGTLANTLLTDALTGEYIMDTFSNVQNEKEGVMKCQCEYIISGKNSDYKNVKSVIHKILAIRFPINFSYILTDAAKVAAAQSAATAIAGATANPAIIELVKYLLLACESYAEAIMDVKTLMHGGEVELLKNAANWQLSLKNLGSKLGQSMQNKVLDSNGKNSKIAMDYPAYLKLLLLIQSDKEEKYSRMLDIIQNEGKSKNPNFDIHHMVFSFRADAKVGLTPFFTNIVGSNMGGTKDYTFTLNRKISY